MKKKFSLLILGISLMVLILSACSGDYILTNAKIVEKSNAERYKIVVEKNEDQYTYYVTPSDYNKYRVGSLVDVSDTAWDGIVLTPGGSIHK